METMNQMFLKKYDFFGEIFRTGRMNYLKQRYEIILNQDDVDY